MSEGELQYAKEEGWKGVRKGAQLLQKTRMGKDTPGRQHSESDPYKGKSQRVKVNPRTRDAAEGESGSNPCRVFSMAGQSYSQHTQELYRSEKAKYQHGNSDEQQPRKTVQQMETPEQGNRDKLPFLSPKHNNNNKSEQTQMQQEALKTEPRNIAGEQNDDEGERTLAPQEPAIPQKQDKILAGAMEAKDQAIYWEIIEGTPTFRTGSVISLQRKQDSQETGKEDAIDGNQSSTDWEKASRENATDQDLPDNQSSQRQSTQQTDQQNGQMSQDTCEGGLREMILRSRPNNARAQEISKMNAMISDHRFPHRSNFCKPKSA